ncbi:NAD(P)H-dependent oxidoreductase subunit E [Nonomuraea africana]|uniref:NADH-quinone oxidoreductase subunit F n=1 Tax=Nonomuraea africana TaxID=46171 RepID=A0ABR9KJV2_9ACTN|nr:NADH-ubiquinone oxidoreductase-F iron-sulfur binding region domain-containing protein [Nonomuraea africana]MBE1562297.1 NADH-quinone oxidoreductase subunit F [Nonomuraea africana]
MDLHFGDAEPTAEERAAVDALLGPPATAWEGGDRTAADLRSAARAEQARDRLLPALHAVNDRVGWISDGALTYICRRLTIPPAEAYGVASFYSLFSLEPRPPRVLHVCTDLACLAKGVREVRDGVPSPCLGLCERAPAALALEAGETPKAVVYGGSTAEDETPHTVERPEPPVEDAVPQAGSPGLVLLGRIGVVDPASLDDYRANGGYQALRRAFELGPVGVIREVTEAGLVGRGGAAFPTGRKWDATARQPDQPHYLVCNADESEPGTFKDRVLMEGDPYALVEAMTIAAYATGCRKGYLYIRGEYPRATRALETAIETARARGLLGPRVLGHDFAFDIELRRGAGAYICGEETAIFNSIEGYRGEPRTKPPFPVEKGLFGKPTVVNNVETLVNVLPILLTGGSDTKLFCVSGSVGRPGVYELPLGTPLRELIDLARPAGTLKAVLLGGAAGSFVTDLDVPLSFEGTRAAGATLGSGVVMVLDEEVDLPAFLVRIAAFFRDESCGQCVPCRVGTVRQEEALHRLGRRRSEADLVLLREVGQTMRDASICGLGQTAWNAVESAIDRLGAFK